MPQILPVLLGGDANVYGMARSFYETYGVRSLAVCRRALPALAHSRIVQVAAQDPAFERDSVFTATLLGLAEQYPGRTRLLISCADGYTQIMARCAAELRGTYRFACPPPAALALADKQQFAAACRAVGLRTPQSITVYPGTLCSSCHSAGRSSSSLLTRPPGGTAISRASARSIWPGMPPNYRRFCPQPPAAATAGPCFAGAHPRPGYAAGGRERLLRRRRQCAVACAGAAPLQERTPEGIGNYAAVLVEPARQDTALLEALRGLCRRRAGAALPILI